MNSNNVDLNRHIQILSFKKISMREEGDFEQLIAQGFREVSVAFKPSYQNTTLHDIAAKLYVFHYHTHAGKHKPFPVEQNPKNPAL